MQELDTINIGQHADDGTGDVLRDGMGKVNSNFSKVSAGVSAVETTLADTAQTATEAKTTADAAIPAAQKGMAGGVAPLDASGKVPAAHLPVQGDYIAAEEKGSADGVAPLDAGTKVPLANLPVGTAGGVAPLDDAGKVPAANLPATVDAIPLSQKGVAGGVAPLDDSGKVPAGNLPPSIQDDVGFVILYPGGTPNMPDTIPANTRLVLDNPFPGYALHVVAEVHMDQWGDPGWFSAYLPNSGEDYRGVRAHHILESDKIIVQSGRVGTFYPGFLSGGALDYEDWAQSYAYYRLKVWKLAKVTLPKERTW